MPAALLPATLVGSLPRPPWLATPESVRPRWLLEGPLLREGQDDAVLLAIKLQEEVGLDVLTDGEQRRRHYIDEFARALDIYGGAKDVQPNPGGQPLAARYLDAIRRQAR